MTEVDVFSSLVLHLPPGQWRERVRVCALVRSRLIPPSLFCCIFSFLSARPPARFFCRPAHTRTLARARAQEAEKALKDEADSFRRAFASKMRDKYRAGAAGAGPAVGGAKKGE